MNYATILLLFLNNISFYHCLFKNSKHVKQFLKVSDLEKDMKNSKNKAGMVFIYGYFCGHCHRFAETYNKLADNFYTVAEFYAMSLDTDYNKKFGRVYAVPHILFYSNNKYTKHSGDRSFERISNILKENYLTYCKEISFADIQTTSNEFFNKKESKNLIIGFFKNKKETELFTSISKKLYDRYIDNCYVCSDFEAYKSSKINNIIYKDINNHVLGYLNKERNEIMKFNWDSDNKLIEKQYEEFILNDIYFGYDDIYSNDKLFILDDNPNGKNILVFGYQNSKEKNNFELSINNELFSLSKNISLSFYKIILYDFKNANNEKLKNITKTGIYEFDKDYKNITTIEDINLIKKKIKKEMNFTEVYQKEDDKKNISNIVYNSSNLNISENRSELVIEINEDPKFQDSRKIKFKINRLMIEKISLVFFFIINMSFLYTFFYCKYYQNANKNSKTNISNKTNKTNISEIKTKK